MKQPSKTPVFLLSLLFLLSFGPIRGQVFTDSLLLEEGHIRWEIDSVLHFYLDSSQAISPDKLLSTSAPISSTFSDSLTGELPLTVDLWAILRLHNSRQDSLSLLWPTQATDLVELFIYQDKKLLFHKKNGIQTKVSERDFKVGTPETVSLIIPPNQSYTLLIKKHEAEGDGPSLKTTLWEREIYVLALRGTKLSDLVVLIGFLSVLGIIFLYNLIIYFSTRELTYLFYGFYLVSIGMTLFMENPVLFFHTWGFDDTDWNKIVSVISFASTTIWYILFGRKFIKSWSLTPRWDSWLKGIIGLRVLTIFLGLGMMLTVKYGWAGEEMNTNFFNILLVLMGMETLFMTLYFIPLIRSGSVIARFFVAGSGLLFFVGFSAIIIQQLFDFNTFLFFLGGIILEILVFSLGLGYRFRKSQKDKLAAEKALNRELSKINTAFGRFVPHEFLQSLGHETVTQVQLGDQVEKEVTVFFSDIRGYTTLSESMTPEENFYFLNSYLGRVGPIIKDNQGFVNQYFGDGIMALFMNQARHAVSASVAIQEKLRTYNLERKKKERIPIKIGIGLHTGPLMMGIIGDQLRMDATVVSDTVNTASRMEGLTKYYGADLILSETVVHLLPEDHGFDLRYLGKVLVKGRRQPLDIYECLDACEISIRKEKSRLKASFEKGIEAYIQRRFAEALRQFEDLLTTFPEDKAAKHYAARAQQYLLEGVEEDWNGVETMMNK